MLDWNEDEEVRGTTWGNLNGTEDYIVPYPQGSDNDTLLTVDEYHQKRKHEQTRTTLSATELRKSESKNEFPGSNFESDSNFNTDEELSAPRFDMDPWPDLPSLNSAFGRGYMDRNHLHSLSSKFISSCTAPPDVDTVTENLVSELCDADGVIQNRELSLKESRCLPASGLIELDTQHDIFGNDHGGEDGGSFLDCDWANISDFYDLDSIFRNNGSVFGHEIIGNADELLSPPADVITPIAPPCSVPVDEQSGGETKPLEEAKMVDNTASISGQIGRHSQLINVNSEIHNHISEKADREKKLPKSRKKSVDKNRTKRSQNVSGWPSNMGGMQQTESRKMQAPLKSPQPLQSAAFGQPMEGGGPGYMGFFHPTSQRVLPAYRYPMRAIPMLPVLSSSHSVKKENHRVPPSHTVYPVSSKYKSEVQSKPLSMTPQEKIQKLRKRQQMQAMLAIRQQQQQFGQQNTSAEMSVSQTSSQTNRSHESNGKGDEVTEAITSSELNMSQELDEPHQVSFLIGDSLGKMIFYQLQDAIGKLDISIRLCIRDSLLRLAKSAMERHNASDRSSTNQNSQNAVAVLVSEEISIQDRSTRLATETGTNPIDRTVAHLLFHRLPEPGAGTVKEEVPPLSSNPVSKWPNTCKTEMEDKQQDTDQLDVKPSL